MSKKVIRKSKNPRSSHPPRKVNNLIVKEQKAFWNFRRIFVAVLISLTVAAFVVVIFAVSGNKKNYAANSNQNSKKSEHQAPITSNLMGAETKAAEELKPRVEKAAPKQEQSEPTAPSHKLPHHSASAKARGWSEWTKVAQTSNNNSQFPNSVDAREHATRLSDFPDPLRMTSYTFPTPRSLEGFPCRHCLACEDPSACNITTGRCEPRLRYKARANENTLPPAQQVKHLSIEEGQPGDILLVDGSGLFYEEGGYRSKWNRGQWEQVEERALLTKVFIGDREVPLKNQTYPDDSRLTILLEDWMSGPVKVTFDYMASEGTSKQSIKVRKGPRGVISCMAEDPLPTMHDGEAPYLPGKYAASFVDVHKPDPLLRIYYPSTCGGMRRPIANGKFPLLMILHGDGSPHINYEYLGRYLATWGYIVLNPQSDDPSMLNRLLRIGLSNPGQWFTQLTGRTKAGKTVLIGHSRGAERAESLALDYAKDVVKGVVYMGPHRPLRKLATPSMIMMASGDFQAQPKTVYALWYRQPSPSHLIYINGGNHSQFTDNRHWELYGRNDAIPLISRNTQFTLVQGYILAFTQNVLEQEQNFSDLLLAMNPPLQVEHMIR